MRLAIVPLRSRTQHLTRWVLQVILRDPAKPGTHQNKQISGELNWHELKNSMKWHSLSYERILWPTKRQAALTSSVTRMTQQPHISPFSSRDGHLFLLGRQNLPRILYRRRIQWTHPKKQYLTTLSSCKLFEHTGWLVSLPTYLWIHYSIIDANIVDQAGPEGSCWWVHSTTNIQTTNGTYQSLLCVSSYEDVVHVERSTWSISIKPYAMPVPIEDFRMGVTRTSMSVPGAQFRHWILQNRVYLQPVSSMADHDISMRNAFSP